MSAIKSVFFPILAVLLPIQEVDLVVAMCAVSVASDRSFKLMKDTVKSIADKYGTSKIHYSVVLYGTQAVPMLKFSDKAQTVEEFKQQIGILPKPKGNIYETFITFRDSLDANAVVFSYVAIESCFIPAI